MEINGAKNGHSEDNVGEPEEFDEKVEALVACLREHGCALDCLKSVNIPGAGRGLITTQAIRPSTFLLRLSESVLITSTTVIQSVVAPAIARHPLTLNAFEALCLFVMAEMVRRTVSPWRPFLDTLPDEESVVALAFTIDPDREEEAGKLLPPKCRSKYYEQLREIDGSRRSVLKVWRDAKEIVGNGMAVEKDEERLFRWAWSCVNSRCIYKENTSPSALLRNPEEDGIALAPFLDMLNHSARTRVQCNFSSVNRTFDVFTSFFMPEGEQVFICYGLHSNAILLLEYGFVLNDNPNNAVYLEEDDLRRLCDKARIPVTERNWKAVTDSKLCCALYVTEPEPPWTFMATMKLLSMKEEELANYRQVFDFVTFEEPSVIKLSAAILREYLSELQNACPNEEALCLFPKKFRSMIMQVWRDDMGIVTDALQFLDEAIR